MARFRGQFACFLKDTLFKSKLTCPSATHLSLAWNENRVRNYRSAVNMYLVFSDLLRFITEGHVHKVFKLRISNWAAESTVRYQSCCFDKIVVARGWKTRKPPDSQLGVIVKISIPLSTKSLSNRQRCGKLKANQRANKTLAKTFWDV